MATARGRTPRASLPPRGKRVTSVDERVVDTNGVALPIAHRACTVLQVDQGCRRAHGYARTRISNSGCRRPGVSPLGPYAPRRFLRGELDELRECIVDNNTVDSNTASAVLHAAAETDWPQRAPTLRLAGNGARGGETKLFHRLKPYFQTGNSLKDGDAPQSSSYFNYNSIAVQ